MVRNARVIHRTIPGARPIIKSQSKLHAALNNKNLNLRHNVTRRIRSDNDDSIAVDTSCRSKNRSRDRGYIRLESAHVGLFFGISRLDCVV